MKSAAHCVAGLDGCSKFGDDVGTIIHGCHGCHVGALVSENGRCACQTPFKPQAVFFACTVKLLCSNVQHETSPVELLRESVLFIVSS